MVTVMEVNIVSNSNYNLFLVDEEGSGHPIFPARIRGLCKKPLDHLAEAVVTQGDL